MPARRKRVSRMKNLKSHKYNSPFVHHYRKRRDRTTEAERAARHPNHEQWYRRYLRKQNHYWNPKPLGFGAFHHQRYEKQGTLIALQKRARRRANYGNRKYTDEDALGRLQNRQAQIWRDGEDTGESRKARIADLPPKTKMPIELVPSLAAYTINQHRELLTPYLRRNQQLLLSRQANALFGPTEDDVQFKMAQMDAKYEWPPNPDFEAFEQDYPSPDVSSDAYFIGTEDEFKAEMYEAQEDDELSEQMSDDRDTFESVPWDLNEHFMISAESSIDE